MGFRTRTVLFASIVLLVIWYFVCGGEEIRWWILVHDAKRQGWDLSNADRYPHYGVLCPASLLGAVTLLLVCLTRAVQLVIDKKSKEI
jgi:hypothetical protein